MFFDILIVLMATQIQTYQFLEPQFCQLDRFLSFLSDSLSVSFFTFSYDILIFLVSLLKKIEMRSCVGSVLLVIQRIKRLFHFILTF